MVTADKLRSLLVYEPTTGKFTWRSPANGARAAGSRSTDGYIKIKLSQRMYRAHRLAWLYVHGRWPSGQIDHINGDRSDNRLSNLRDTTQSQNQANAKVRKDSRSGVKGVFPVSKKKWGARKNVGGKIVFLGSFDTKAEAHAAYLGAARAQYGEYARSE